MIGECKCECECEELIVSVGKMVPIQCKEEREKRKEA